MADRRQVQSEFEQDSSDIDLTVRFIFSAGLVLVHRLKDSAVKFVVNPETGTASQ